ncbi:efflux RND transporter periplasmic adaptor subunit [Adhaeribacter sp. BT258]|uniref:Efflux RND transporter periplasmic adaptor subunit n=1 Tax=Adhaeribacter terrigena TaxID=2793070 RepID=A0ABS1C5A0_9BACT|nr:efflux RND transporter periplasmic adaptor subunit [Adhaeribacter terrigena]MBK0403833.1 efflux RND transporter periplasmic adaptor subunit [Adhaeribacter terrigena]
MTSTFKRSSLFFAFFASVPFFLGSCSQTSANREVPLNHEDFCLTDTIASMIKVEKAQLQPVENQLPLSGKITFDEQKVFKVFPLVGGYVQQVKVELGDYVQKGQTLAVLKSGEVADLKQELIQTQAKVQLADKNLDVTEEMFKAGLASQKDFLAAQQEHKRAQAELNRMKEMFQIYSVGHGSEYIVKAPASGFIVEKKINADTQVRSDNDDNLFTISSMNEIWVMANVYESDIAKIKDGYEAEVTTLSYPDKILKGKVDKIYNVLDPTTRVMKVRIKLENPGYELKPEMFANVLVKYQEDKELIAVPATAIIFDQNKTFAMVYRKNCDLAPREVAVYQTVGKTAYLNSGVKAGENVISGHQLLVYDAYKTN